MSERETTEQRSPATPKRNGYCRKCRRWLSPLREALRFDARELTPTLVLKITRAAAVIRTFKRATTVINEMAGEAVSAKKIERVIHDAGRELSPSEKA